jgi:outer membrane protein OmpA-like peptidoglycan-associated protein
MSAKQQTQPKVQKPKPAHQAAVPEVAQLGPKLLPAGLAQVGSLNGLPDHGTVRSLRQASILQMQQRYGNSYVQAVLTRQSERGSRLRQSSMIQRSAPALQRWEADEHRLLGDITKIRIDIGEGVQLTFGQVIALAGDEFGSLEELMDATKTENGRKMIRAHLERARIPGTAAAMLPAPTEEQEKQAFGEYVTLALDNSSHFVGGGTAVENWLEKHAKAIDLAIQAGLYKDGALLNEAYLTEAFGQHFLTDAFSSGHIRVPREDIRNYYVNDFTPAVFDHLIAHLRARLIDEVYDQIDEQTWVNEGAAVAGYMLGVLGGPVSAVGGLLLGGLGLRAYIRRRIRNKINAKLNEAFAAAGGRAEAIKYVGLGLAGVVAGAMHDMENREGLWVINDFSAIPWEAYGDEHLRDEQNEDHREQIEEAVRASVADLQTAYNIGLEEGQILYNVPEPEWIPETVYFGFDLDTLSLEAANNVDMVADFLNYNPAARLTLVGHADPIGRDPYNEDLSSRRAHRVAHRLAMKGVDLSRIEVQSKGESMPVTTDRRQYHRNRRVEFVYSTDAAVADQGPDQVALENARRMTLERIGPAYLAEGYLPRAAEGLNAELPEWHWGAIPEPFRREMANWIKHYVEEYGEGALEAEALEDITEDTPIGKFTISPRPIARRILGEITTDPIRFLERALGRGAGP